MKGGVDAKELFHVYILVWIQDKRLALLESCKLDKVCTSWFCCFDVHFLGTYSFMEDMITHVVGIRLECCCMETNYCSNLNVTLNCFTSSMWITYLEPR